LSTRLSQEALEGSFDVRLHDRISAAEFADKQLGRARVEYEWRDQLAAISRQQRKALGATILNIVAGAAVLIALVLTLSTVPVIPRIAHVIGDLPQYSFGEPFIVLSLAASLTVVAIWIARLLDSSAR
jgi:hypothetical protein